MYKHITKKTNEVRREVNENIYKLSEKLDETVKELIKLRAEFNNHLKYLHKTDESS